MIFEIEGKVAIVTGGASGIGLSCVKELLRNAARGVTMADVNTSQGENIIKELDKEFGQKKVIFVKTDVTNQQEFENAFKRTIEAFRCVDILINSAGVFDDTNWEKEIAINLGGVIRGTILGLENFLPKYKQGREAVIVNLSSLAGITGFYIGPVYAASKFGVRGATLAWGSSYHYERTKVKVLAICPGFTETPLITGIENKVIGKAYEDELKKYEGVKWQSSDFVAKEMMKVIRKAESGTAWVVDDGEPAYKYILPERQTMKGNTI